MVTGYRENYVKILSKQINKIQTSNPSYLLFFFWQGVGGNGKGKKVVYRKKKLDFLSY